MAMSVNRRRRIALALTLAMSLTACTNDNGGEEVKADSISSAEGVQYVTEYLGGRQEGLLTVGTPYYRSLDEALPNVQYLHPDGKLQAVTDLAVVGSVVGVDKGRGFTIPGCDPTKRDTEPGTCDAPGGVASGFDAPNALWWTVHATVEVERSIGSSGSPPAKVTVALPIDAPHHFDLMSAGLKALGTLALFLKKNTPLTEYDPSLYIVIYEHALIARVARDGTLSLPMIHDDETAKRFLAPVPRLADLESRGRTPRTIPLQPGPTGPTRNAV